MFKNRILKNGLVCMFRFDFVKFNEKILIDHSIKRDSAMRLCLFYFLTIYFGMIL